MPGASLQFQGDGMGGQAITPAPSVMNFPMENNETPFAFSEFSPGVVRVGEQATYRLMVNCSAGEAQPPETIVTSTGLKLARGASSQEMVFLNNRVRRILVYNYHCTPDKPGIVAVPGFRFLANGMVASTLDAYLEVGSSDDFALPRPPELVLQIPDRNVYVGETIPVHVMVSNPGAGLLLNVSALELSGDGMIMDRDSIFLRQRKTMTNPGGKMAVTIETEALVTLLRAGPLTLNAQAEATVNPPQPMPSLLQGYRPLIEAVPLTIRPLALPAGGTLPGFNGAIGRFQMQPVLSANSVFVGEPVDLSVIVQGEGNLRTIAAPEPAKDAAWKILPPAMDPPQMNGGAIVRMFHYTLIPTTDQVKSTPPIPFSYFDPATAKYVDLTFPPQPVTVVPLPTNEAEAFAATQSGRPPAGLETVEEPEDTLRPLADTRGKIAGTLIPLQARPWFLLVQLIPATLLAGLWLWDRRRRFLAAHPEVLALRAARRACRRHRAVAQAAVLTEDRLAFTTAVVGAIREVCAPRIDAHPDSLVCSDVLQLLPPRRLEQDREFVSKFFAELGAHRFGNEPVETGAWSRDLAAATELLEGLDGELQMYVNHRVRQRANGGSFARADQSLAIGKGASRGVSAMATPGVLMICLALFSSTARARSTDGSSTPLTPDKFQQGVAAYVAGNYDPAAAAFRESANEQPSAGAFRNLGNAEWQRGRAGDAILAWERAVWLDPFDHNSRVNLRFARKAGHLDVPALTWLEACSSWLPADAWAWTAMAGFWFPAALLVLSHVFRWRKSYWHQLGVALGLTIFLLTLPALAGIQSRAHRGVIVADETPARLTPTVHGEILARLPAGETAMFGRQKGPCFYIQTASGTSGWANTNGFRLIAE